VRRSRIAVLAAAVVTACLLADRPRPGPSPGPGKAMVRVAHFSPDASYVDVYMVSLNRKQLFPNVVLQVGVGLLVGGRRAVHLRGSGRRATPESEPVIRVKGRSTPARPTRWRRSAGGPAPGAAAARRHGAVGAGAGQGAVPGRGLRPAGGRHRGVGRAGAAVAGVPGADPVPAAGLGPLPGRGAALGGRRRGRQGVGRGQAGHGHLGGARRRGWGAARAVRLQRCRRVPVRRRPAASAPGRAGPLPPPAPRPPRCPSSLPAWPCLRWGSPSPGGRAAPRPERWRVPIRDEPPWPSPWRRPQPLLLGACRGAVDSASTLLPRSVTLPEGAPYPGCGAQACPRGDLPPRRGA
jgi:hypothetical protein